MLPSIATLERAFPNKGETLRYLLQSADYVRKHPAAIRLEKRSYNPQPLSRLRLEALDSEAETYGVEAIACDNGQFIDYLNVGDMYIPTLVRFWDGRYRVACVGDLVERYCKRGG